MKQFKTQVEQPVLKQKPRKWNWKKLVVLSGAGAILITSTGLITWAVTKELVQTKVDQARDPNLPLVLPELTYQTMTPEQFNQTYEKFYAIKNEFIKTLATEQLQFFLSTNDYQEIKADVFPSQQQTNSVFDLAPNLQNLLKEKMINAVGSNLRVWGLNTGYAFAPSLTEINFNLDSWTLKNERENKKEYISFDLDLGYAGVDSAKTFKLKGKLKDSEGITNPIKDFTTENLAKIFQQANDLFNSQQTGLNRQGYFIGLDFNGEKDDDKVNPGNNEGWLQEWTTSQTVNLQEFDSQTWDYVLNSLKNFNLIQEDVFDDGLQLFKIDGWNPEKLFVKDKTKVKVNEDKNEVWLGKENDFGPHSIVSKIMVSYKADEKINFEFTGSYLQNSQWGNY